jgi:hypothetical protein
MAKENWVKLFAPDGSPVEVLDTSDKDNPRGRVEVLKERGYTTSKPRNPTKSANTSDSPELAQLRAEMEQLKAENDDLKAKTPADGSFAPPQTGTETTPKK